MPRRIYTYDAAQGYTGFNQIATAGYGLLFVSVLIFLYNAARSLRRGRVAGDDPWQAGTLEWSIPSPPPEYNFAAIPRVTSRYPLWEPALPEPALPEPALPEPAPEEPAVRRTARELGIPMPAPTILPLVCASGVVVMFGGLFVLERSTAAGVVVMAAGALWWVAALWGWLTTPLERAP